MEGTGLLGNICNGVPSTAALVVLVNSVDLALQFVLTTTTISR